MERGMMRMQAVELAASQAADRAGSRDVMTSSAAISCKIHMAVFNSVVVYVNGDVCASSVHRVCSQGAECRQR